MAKMDIRRMEIEPAENGGHMVTHYMKEQPSKNGMMPYQEPEEHVFGADEGHDMLAHIANQLNIPSEMKGKALDDEKAEMIRMKVKGSK